MAIILDYNEYKVNSSNYAYAMEKASRNLPKELVIHIEGRNLPLDKNQFDGQEFNVWFLPRTQNEDWKYVSKERFISDKYLIDWFKIIQKEKYQNPFQFLKLFRMSLDEIPQDINLIDMLLSKNILQEEYVFRQIFLEFYQDGEKTRICYKYTIESNNPDVIILGTFARSDSNEWKFFPKFSEAFGKIFVN